MFNEVNMWETVIAIILASTGGLARLLNTKDKTRLQWSRIFSELFISGFSGIMILMLGRSFNLSGDWMGLVCGMAGWVGPRILDLLTKPAGKVIGIDINEVKENETKPQNGG
jgi:hypothetical protein